MPRLRAQGALQGVSDHEQLTDSVSIELTGGHSPGHQIVRVLSGGEQAVIVGHLAVSALHLATGECPPEHMDPAGANTALDKLLAEDAVLIGPLWPAPGACRWNGRALVAVS